MASTQQQAVLSLPDGREVVLPLLKDATGADFLDVRKLYGDAGLFTFDPGFTSTASCESTITYIDGAKGILLYRGYPIEQLAEDGDLVDCTYLLLNGELPSHHERRTFLDESRHRMVHEHLIKFYQGFKSDAHPMAIMVGVVGALSSFYNSGFDIHRKDHRMEACMRIIGKMPTLAAMAYKTSIGEPIIYPRDDLTVAENFLYMMKARPASYWTVDKVAARCLEVIMILHADHEQNASTSTVRVAGSSQANPFACVAAGIACLWGPAHGGANEAVLKMLREIGTPDRVAECVEKAKDKSSSFRLMGFGHRLYKTTDPRARLMRDMCHKLLDHLQLSDPLLEVAQELERVALADEYFIARKLYPNVDFYSGICFRALGIPEEMMTVIFAVSRSIGWCAQWNESMEGSAPRISRPRQMYTGVAEPRTYASPQQRGCMDQLDSKVLEDLHRWQMGNTSPREDGQTIKAVNVKHPMAWPPTPVSICCHSPL